MTSPPPPSTSTSARHAWPRSTRPNHRRTLHDRWLAAVLSPNDGRGLLVATGTPAVLLALAWGASYLAGGSHTAFPHLFYVPILLAAITMGRRGGALAGLVAALLSGPLLPFDVAEAVMQAPLNWIGRGVFFVLIGTATGAGVQAIRDRYEDAIERTLYAELGVSATGYGQMRTSARAERPGSLTAGEVRRMLDARAFHPVFQPIHRLDDGRIVGVEALTRFHGEPYRPPDVWFTRAAALGIGVELELAAADAALTAADQALREGLALSINVSPETLVDPRLVELIASHERRDLVLEVTERAVVDDYHDIDVAMARLRELGARLAVDDAGAGFSSLRHIVRLSPEIIKLDLSLTQGLGADPVRTALADCLVDFAQRTATVLVAEGIEHETDLRVWKELGAHAAQGYLLGRPGPLGALAVLEGERSRS